MGGQLALKRFDETYWAAIFNGCWYVRCLIEQRKIFRC